MKQEFQLDLPNLLYFVKASCHENLHDTLNDLRDLTKVIERNRKNFSHYPQKLLEFLKGFIQKLQRHLALEENSLFPFLESGRQRHPTSLALLKDDHDEMKKDLLKLRKMTQNYQFSIDRDHEFQHFHSKLGEMDRILLNHIQIENSILFPMIQGEYSR